MRFGEVSVSLCSGFDSVMQDVQAFQENWSDALREAHLLYLDHPELVTSGKEGKCAEEANA